jgi:acyl transferase domain-containing protein
LTVTFSGSVKSNIGHLEGAAGVAGVFKAVIAREAGMIPPQTNFEKLNSAIDAEFLNIKVSLPQLTRKYLRNLLFANP